MQILIIDDDPEDTALFCEAVTELDPLAICRVAHTCEQIHSSAEMIAAVDFIFLAGHMHPVGGKACLAALMEFVDRARTRIIIHSGSLSPAEKNELEETGADLILLKTGSYEELKTNIAEILAIRG